MYIIEYIIKKLTQKKKAPIYNPTPKNETEEYENCEHIFMPIDSTGEVLSCTRCGTLVNQSELKAELKSRNFFVNKDAE